MKRFKNILMYTATEENSAAMSRSVELAMENNADLTLLDVIAPVPHLIGMMTDVVAPQELERLVAQEHRENLLQIAADYSDTGVNLNAVVRVGNAAIEIIREVLEGSHDLVVKTADGCSLRNRLLGTTSQALMRMCPCPVWILKPNTHGSFDRVLVALDLESQDTKHELVNDELLELAHSIAQRENAALHVVAAWDIWMEQSLRRRAGEAEVDDLLNSRQTHIRSALQQLLRDQQIEIQHDQLHVHRGTAGRVISHVVDEMKADLLVLGTMCRQGVAGFLLGSTAEYALAHATCSVLSIKPKDFTSPVSLSDAQSHEVPRWQQNSPLV